MFALFDNVGLIGWVFILIIVILLIKAFGRPQQQPPAGGT